ncbi:MAG: hypothetical protein WCI18_05780 [Pseudomonadota bacterium]
MSELTMPFSISPLNYVDSYDSGTEAYLSANLLLDSSHALVKSGGEGMLAAVMQHCRDHPILNIVHRIAIVRRLGVTNQLRLECSVKDPAVSEELMKKNYTCFVREDSSLFHLTQGVVRIYSDVEIVKKSFYSEKSPVQRSLQKIGEMGLISGLCIPLIVYGNIVGFVFLNSKRLNAFDLSYPQKLLANALQTLGLAVLQSAGSLSFQYLTAAHSNLAINAAAPLSAVTMEATLKAYRMGWDFSNVSVKGDCEAKVLYNQGTMLYVISLFAKSMSETPRIELMSCLEEVIVIKLDFSAQKLVPHTRFESLKAESSFLGVDVRREGHCYFLTQQINYWKDEKVTYSVA